MTAKIYYYRDAAGNFGDDLNTWLWQRLLPNAPRDYAYHGIEFAQQNEQEEMLMVGIGTLLDDRLPRHPIKLICGSGAGYGARPAVDQSWRILWVRGPHTAELLGQPADCAITDGAALLSRIALPAPSSGPDIGFMPHHSTAGPAWIRVCERLGLRYLDPNAEVEKTLADFRALRLVLTEAMHGAIVADTLRIPWTAITTHEQINTFKWQDWCASLALTYQPRKVPALWPLNGGGVAARMKSMVKEELATRALRAIAESPSPELSSDIEFDRALSRLDAAIVTLQRELSQDVRARTG